MSKPKRRRSALETFTGCPHRFDVLYNRCLCGHSRKDHDPVTGECCGQVKNHIRGKSPLQTLQEDSGVDLGIRPSKMVPCPCEAFRSVEDKGDESQRGIAFHEIAFRYTDRLARAHVAADAEEAALAFQEGIALSQVAPHLLPDVSRLWERHSAKFQLNLSAYLMAEERQETERFTWIPDLVYIYPNRVTIIDFKTFFKGLTPDQARKEFQLKMYLLQAMEIWPGFKEYEFVFDFVRLGYEVSTVMTPDEIEEFRPEVEAIMLSMDEAERTDNYPAIQGTHCGLCRLQCPLAENKYKLPVRLMNVDEAQKAAGRYLMQVQEVKALRKALDAWCKTEGPLNFNGHEFLHVTNTERTYPAAEVVDFLRDRGTDEELIALILLSRAALKDFGKPKRAAPAVLEFLQSVEVAKTRWSFKNRKGGEIAPAGFVDVLSSDEDEESDEDE